MDRQALFTFMDRAIDRVARKQYLHLQQRSSNPQTRADEMYAALESLGGLRDGNPPVYDDPWVALFYLTWYQPGQVQLARLLIERMNESRGGIEFLSNHRSSLHVVDFGCGALAMQFAVAWAAAEAIERGSIIDSIIVESYDPATAMIEVGLKFWEQFESDTSKEPQFRSLSTVFDRMITQQHGALESLFPCDEPIVTEERWVTAVHTVYQINLESVRSDLSRVTGQFLPDVGILSCNSNKQSIELLRAVSRSSFGNFWHTQQRMSPKASNLLSGVTEWRRSLYQRLARGGHRRHEFLNSDVTLGFHSALGQIYTK